MSKPQARRGGAAPTVKEILDDELTQLSLKHWAPAGQGAKKKKTPAFSAKLVKELYTKELQGGPQRVMLLELSRYLECYLWPNFGESASDEHTLSIMAMVNEKCRENMRAWECFHDDESKFTQFMEKVFSVALSEEISLKQRELIIVFLSNCFQSLEDELIRTNVLPLAGLATWHHIPERRRNLELKALPRLAKHWKYLQKLERKQAEGTKGEEGKDKKKKRRSKGRASKGAQPQSEPAAAMSPKRDFLPVLIRRFLEILGSIEDEMELKGDDERIKYCERFVHFLTTLVSQLPTRRFLRTVVECFNVVVICEMSALASLKQGSLFNKLVSTLRYFQWFEINDFTGTALSADEMMAVHCEQIQRMQRLRLGQRIAYEHFPELKTLALANIGTLEQRTMLKQYLRVLDDDAFARLCIYLGLLDEKENEQADSRAFMEEVLFSAMERHESMLESLTEQPIYPTEALMWDSEVMPTDHSPAGVLPLPQLNLQFLTLHDYLLRSFQLYRLESAYEIREDLADVLKRVKPRLLDMGSTAFTGWARMALPIHQFKITSVRNPHIGERHPKRVIAEITLNLSAVQPALRAEWCSLRLHDVLYLLSVKSTVPKGQSPDPSKPFLEKSGLRFARGCEVFEILDEKRNVIDERATTIDHTKAQSRTLRVWLDPRQWLRDQQDGLDVYTSLNLVVRRHSKENNFKAVLSTIQKLLSTKCAIPEWLYDVFLGYGDPSAANCVTPLKELNYVDTFLDVDHIREAFAGHEIALQSEDIQKPFIVTFGDASRMDDGEQGEGEQKHITVSSKPRINVGPYPVDQPKENSIRFTPRQVEAITSGLHEGLTLIVGPPGTGKTDVAVQIINLLYHNHPKQRTLLITHSNQALNQLFEKIAALDIAERHLVRLGHGQDQLATDADFSRFGRVEMMMAERDRRLQEVDRLAASIGVSEDVGYTCETAGYFFVHHVKPRWSEFEDALRRDSDDDAVRRHFPFTTFFENAPQPLFNDDRGVDLEVAQGCFRHIERIFEALNDIRPFELLPSSYDRTNYLVTTQAKIIAMTCTHASLKRDDLIRLGFKFDNVVMEEAGQALDIESFIPLMLQPDDETGMSRLKRVVLIGDHNQLPPVVQNSCLSRYSHLDQSLFTRLVRLQVPTIELNAQGRCRPSLAQLFNWKYTDLGDLPVVVNDPEYKLANAGCELRHYYFFSIAPLRFAHDYQFINVNDFHGKGEIEPTPHFIQNLGEAEYVVAVFQYMRILGYPANKISIITTYNGQKHLIRDVLRQRCAHPFFGLPSKVTTVDRFQGQQNDYILLSLVRTRTVGHIRDVRRLIVAMSRARLGLYVFGRRSLFENCYELTKAFHHLLQRPDQLVLANKETFPTTRKDTEAPAAGVLQVESVMQMGELVMRMTTAAQQAYSSALAPSIQAAPAQEEPKPEGHGDAMDTE